MEVPSLMETPETIYNLKHVPFNLINRQLLFFMADRLVHIMW